MQSNRLSLLFALFMRMVSAAVTLTGRSPAALSTVLDSFRSVQQFGTGRSGWLTAGRMANARLLNRSYLRLYLFIEKVFASESNGLLPRHTLSIRHTNRMRALLAPGYCYLVSVTWLVLLGQHQGSLTSSTRCVAHRPCRCSGTCTGCVYQVDQTLGLHLRKCK